MFTTFIVQPIFNVLVLIYTLLPGHNFGLAIIIFTIIVRMALWPLVRKQLHQSKLMRDLQPEIKEIKKKAKGDRRKESEMVMELMKERGANPAATLLILIPQIVILFGLYSGLTKVINDPNAIVSFAYPFLQNTDWLQQLAGNIKLFDETLFGVVDLTRAPSSSVGIYLPALLIAIASSVAQFYQSKMLLPDAKNARRLRDILKDASNGKQADQAEMQAATSKTMLIILPIFIFILTISLPAALGLYWLVGGLVAIVQQSIIMRETEEDLEEMADKSAKRDVKAIPEAEVVEQPVAAMPKKPKKKKSKANTKRRKK